MQFYVILVLAAVVGGVVLALQNMTEVTVTFFTYAATYNVAIFLAGAAFVGALFMWIVSIHRGMEKMSIKNQLLREKDYRIEELEEERKELREKLSKAQEDLSQLVMKISGPYLREKEASSGSYDLGVDTRKD